MEKAMPLRQNFLLAKLLWQTNMRFTNNRKVWMWKKQCKMYNRNVEIVIVKAIISAMATLKQFKTEVWARWCIQSFLITMFFKNVSQVETYSLAVQGKNKYLISSLELVDIIFIFEYT